MLLKAQGWPARPCLGCSKQNIGQQLTQADRPCIWLLPNRHAIASNKPLARRANRLMLSKAVLLPAKQIAGLSKLVGPGLVLAIASSAKLSIAMLSKRPSAQSIAGASMRPRPLGLAAECIAKQSIALLANAMACKAMCIAKPCKGPLGPILLLCLLMLGPQAQCIAKQ